MFSKQCKLHLDEVGKTGPEHMAFALKTAVKLQLLVPALVVHAVAPRFFTHTATNVMKDILNEADSK